MSLLTIARPDVGAQPRPVSWRASGMRDFDEFYSAHRDEIGRALTFTFRDQTLGQEAVDEAMARAYQRWDSLGATANPAGWVYVTGRRWGLSWLRGRRREHKRELAVTTDASDMRWRTVADDADGTTDYLHLMDALAHLNVDHRSVVVCRFSLGMSVAETASALGVREGTVKSRLARAVEQLRQVMGERNGDTNGRAS